LALTSPTSGGRSVGIVRLRTKTTVFVLFVYVERSGGGVIMFLFWNFPGGAEENHEQSQKMFASNLVQGTNSMLKIL
jgi:hypothetical protein